ncbi:MAG: hypothetical protein ACI9RL_001423 [Candidatus Paceibacteria bacterium]|jgi:hypothetical protein
MKTLRILLFFISALFATEILVAQENAGKYQDTVAQKTKYGLRFGVDLAMPLRSLLEDGYTGFEILGDVRIQDRFYLAAELGSEKKDYFEPNINAISKGSYFKVGVNYNAYLNWIGMTNEIFTGVRYGFSRFSQELLGYNIYTTNQSFPPAFVTEPKEFKGLSAHWAELILGVKTEISNNVYLSINLQLKRKISEDTPENFDNLYIPGFNRTYDASEWGVGYGYTITYLLPIFKK